MATYFEDFGVECDLIVENGIVTHTSKVFCQLTEFKPDECVGQTITYLLRDMLRLSLEPSDIIDEMEAFLFTKSHEARNVRIQLLSLRENNTEVSQYIIFEIPNSRIENKALYLDQLCGSNLVGIAVYSIPNLILLKANEKYLNFLNPPYNERQYSIGARANDIFLGWFDSMLAELLKEVLQTGRSVYTKEMEYIGPDERVTYWDLVLTPLIENGKIHYIVSNTIEVTERVYNRKLIEEQVNIINSKNQQLESTIADLRIKEDELNQQHKYIQKQKDLLIETTKEKNEALQHSMKIKDEFLYTITHEFKTPITVINTALQAMDLIYKDQIPEKANRYIETIRQNINRQMRLVNNLLDITRINTGNLRLNEGVYDLVFLTRSIVKSIQPIAQDKELRVSFRSELSHREILIDEEKFERILLNLLSNAIKFTPKGNAIDVHLFVKRQMAKNMVCVSVQDEGIGIPGDKQYFIFERFGQVNSSLCREAEGTGIGLYLVKLLINAMDGYISLSSEMGKGSKFTVMFPDKTNITHKDDVLSENPESRRELIENRLIQSTSIELSDIYI